MKISGLEAKVVKLPFRFAFKHSLASRNYSENLIVRATLSDGSELYRGFGEGIPRDYVTGETLENALARLQREFFPRFLDRQIADFTALTRLLRDEFADLQLDKRAAGAAWCALELALLDACGQWQAKPLSQLLGGVKECHHNSGIQYGAVIPFGGKRAATAMLWFYKLFGFATVKLKVGKSDEADLELVRIARAILGEEAILRVDANCAWNAEQTIRMADSMRRYRVASIEQPVPADDIAALIKITDSIPEPVMVDESLCTLEQARTLVREKACRAFNVRISKVGGLFAGQAMVDIARNAGFIVQMGAQVGESGLLSAAGRTLASVNDTFENCEGSNNFFLLQKDLTEENLNVGFGGRGKLLPGNGLGVKVKSGVRESLMNDSVVDNRSLVASNW